MRSGIAFVLQRGKEGSKQASKERRRPKEAARDAFEDQDGRQWPTIIANDDNIDTRGGNDEKMALELPMEPPMELPMEQE